ncbi:MAG TPA: GNAT family N-acetyltransferase [Ktedonobacteraceae bacterium]|jgi:predicted N-acetyltransferase YhbS
MTVSIVVRAIKTDAERDRKFYLSEIAFSTTPSPENVTFWQNYITTLPNYRPEQIRVAFKGDLQVGGCEILERVMHMGEARLATGCIGSVNTDPEQRNQGIASALMRDAIAYAREKHYAFLMLDGIPKFYYRFGYTDIFDATMQDVDRLAILAQQPSSYTVREATIEDAQSILDLYKEQQYSYTASFTRTLEMQQHAFQNRMANIAHLLSCDASGKVHGFLSLGKEADRRANELLADDWQATLALLQYHANQFAENDAPATLRYRLPNNHPITYQLIEHLQIPDTSHVGGPNTFGSVLSQSYHHRHTGWMARIIDLPAVVQGTLPEWQARWQRSLAHWSGVLRFVIDGEPFALTIDGTQISIGEPEEQRGHILHFSQQAFTQLLFGYRPITWFLQENETKVSPDALAALSILFPIDHTFITRSDDF